MQSSASYSCANASPKSYLLMRKTLSILAIPVLAALALSQQSCKDIAAHVFNQFNTEPHEVRFRIPIIPTSGGDFMVYDTVDTKIDVAAQIDLQTNGTYTIDDVESITLHSIRITLDSADVLNNWANFSDVDFKLRSPQYYLTETIGTKRDIWDAYATELTLDPSGKAVNVHRHFSTGDVIFEITGKNRRPTTKELWATAYVTFTVTPK